MPKVYIVGCGGVGSFLVPVMCKLVGPNDVILVDGDRLEPKNLDRQLFEPSHVGKFKSEALSKKYKCSSIPEWYTPGGIQHSMSDWILVCADNHPARAAALDACDQFHCQCVVGCNETLSSEAFYYQHEWKGTRMDPRVYYPEILTSHANDPARAAIGCTGEAQEQNRQLVTANFMAAAMMGHLYVVWEQEAPGMEREAWIYLPHRRSSTLSGWTQSTVKDSQE
jgi:hypothetical protein